MYYLVGDISDYNMHSEKTEQFVNELLTLRRLANKHHNLAEMDCNGSGYIRGQAYYSGRIDEYAKREYGYNVKCSYGDLLPEVDTPSIFQIECDKVETKIKAICERLGLRVEFQGDPRGYTVKVFKGDRFLDIQQ
jgi:hypothetical protein